MAWAYLRFRYSKISQLWHISTVFENRQKKVAFNIASEASYVYILNGQKFNKDAKLVQSKMPKVKKSNATFWVIFKHCD